MKQWWAAKSDEIYKAIPDFGGFLVKANSEGEPGPQDYNRTHADGANMFAEALARSGNGEGARTAACRAVALGVASARERCGGARGGPSP